MTPGRDGTLVAVSTSWLLSAWDGHGFTTVRPRLPSGLDAARWRGYEGVVEDADGVARLRIDNRQQEGSSATLRVDGRQALIPLLLHPSPRHALFLGLGTGVTASTAARDTRVRPATVLATIGSSE